MNNIGIIELMFIWIMVSILGSMLFAKFSEIGKGKKYDE